MNRNITQEFIANRIGINTSHISNIENNKTKVSLTTLVHICNSLGVSVDYILSNELPNASDAIERELLIEIQRLDIDKKEQILRIVKVI